jgi:hypothetical protein
MMWEEGSQRFVFEAGGGLKYQLALYVGYSAIVRT